MAQETIWDEHDAVLAQDPDLTEVMNERFSAVIETEGSIFGLGADGWDAARLDKEVQP